MYSFVVGGVRRGREWQQCGSEEFVEPGTSGHTPHPVRPVLHVAGAEKQRKTFPRKSENV